MRLITEQIKDLMLSKYLKSVLMQILITSDNIYNILHLKRE